MVLNNSNLYLKPRRARRTRRMIIPSGFILRDLRVLRGKIK